MYYPRQVDKTNTETAEEYDLWLLQVNLERNSEGVIATCEKSPLERSTREQKRLNDTGS